MTATLLVQIAAKATLVLLVGFGMTRAMVRASAAARHLVWVSTLTAALAVPAMHIVGPAWTLAVLPQANVPIVESATILSTASGESVGWVFRPQHAPVGFTDARRATAVSPADSLPAALAAEGARVRAESAVAEPVTASSAMWGSLVVRVWLVGVTLMLLRLAVGIVWASLTVRRADDLPHTGWLDSLDEAAAALGLTRRVGLKVSPRAAVPMATGLWRAVVLLPTAAIEWSEERRRVVLQHELAHVKRRDCLLQALAQCVCAVHWFNPFAHLAVSRLRGEQERACDDLVIAVGTDARSYADHLFEIARSFRAASFPTWAAMSMARPSQLEGRMLAILDDARVRCAPSAWFRVALVASTVILALPFGALRLAAQTPSEAEVASAPIFAQSPDSVSRNESSAENGDGSDVAPNVRSSIDIVHGDLAEVDLLELEPHFRVSDAITVGLNDDGDVKAIDKAIKEATKGMRWSLGQSGTVSQSAPAVSDETRKRVADALITALNDDNSQVRQEALSSLASMRDERAIPGLVRALNDPVADVRMRALGALVQFNSATAADGVLAALKDRNADVREQAARHLASLVSRGQLRDPKYVDAFSALLRDENADVREQAVVALGRLRVPAASGPLTQALKDAAPDVRQQAARALGQLGNAEAVAALTPLLRDPSKDVREQAAQALGDIADPRAIDALTAALKDADPGVREQVARALGQIARGQRRGVRPNVPTPPMPPLPPSAFLDRDRVREMTQRAREFAEDARRDVERAMRDMQRSAPFVVPDPLPVPDPVPAPLLR